MSVGRWLCALLLGVSATALEANVIPVPPGAHLGWEFLRFDVDRTGRVQFQGELYFDSIDETVTDMQFPLPPVNAGSIRVRTDGVPQPWRYSVERYPTLLPEYPWLRMLVMDRIPVPATLGLLVVGLVALAGGQVGPREKGRVARLRRG
jgi:hypothetical protein